MVRKRRKKNWRKPDQLLDRQVARDERQQKVEQAMAVFNADPPLQLACLVLRHAFRLRHAAVEAIHDRMAEIKPSLELESALYEILKAQSLEAFPRDRLLQEIRGIVLPWLLRSGHEDEEPQKLLLES